MTLISKNPLHTQSWQLLQSHFESIQHTPMTEMFANDEQRAHQFHIEWNGLLFDFSKNIINASSMSLLFDFANEMHLKENIQKMFAGEMINVTENRAVAHWALRDVHNHFNYAYHQEVKQGLAKIAQFSDEVISGKKTNALGKPFTHILNIGIGGSDLGPKMVVEALDDYRTHLHIDYISNIDYDAIEAKLKHLPAETTLVIVVSKSFTTLETLRNADIVKNWLHQNGLSEKDHFVAVSSAIDEVQKYGISSGNIFPMWDWVGGRFSLWSSVGLCISLAIGFTQFSQLLFGAHEVDKHFTENNFEENIPVILALLSLWYGNFFKYETEAVIPYCDRLKSLPAYLQQVVMESNGKNVDRNGQETHYQTCNIIWGEVGTDCQHAFFQLLHQGSKIIPADFIGFIKPNKPNELHDLLMSNFFAQTEAFLMGKKETDTQTFENNFKIFKGNRPTNTLLFNQLTPKNLGILLAVYEQKTCVQGALLNIFSFDQFGVEYGKVLAKNIAAELENNQIHQHDASTRFLLDYYLKNR